MKSVLVDAGPLYATAVRSDQHHDRARQELERLVGEGITMTVTYPTLLEAYGLILRRTRIPVAHVWLSEMTMSASLVNPSPEVYLLAGERVQRFPDQPITLFDAIVAVLSERLDLRVWTYDHRFDIMGANVWR